MVYVGYNESKFKNLRKGDLICYDSIAKDSIVECLSDAFYNSDADEPGWEINTEDCTLSINNDIWLITKKCCEKQCICTTAINDNLLNAINEGYQKAINEMQEIIKTNNDNVISQLCKHFGLEN